MKTDHRSDAPQSELGSAVGTDANTWAHWGGDDTERVAELQFPNSVHAYRSMMNDAQIQSLMFGLLLPIRAYKWYLEPNGSDPAVIDRISTGYNLPIGKEDQFDRRRGQRRFSFDKHMEDALRALVYGFYFFEQVGEIGSDGAWHLRKLGIRPPRTLTEINVDSDGSLKEIVQGYDPLGNKRSVPINRLVAYVWDREGANWTGRSMLRSVYRNHIVKDRVLRVGAINIERAGGVPYVEAPEGASGDQIRELDAMARRFRVGEGAGAALPHGAQLKFAAATGGDGAVAYIKQQNEEMARAFLQMVTMLGQTNSGSRGLGNTFHDILRIAQYTVAKWFADLFNEHVIEDDVEWNEGPEQDFAPLLAFDAGAQDPMVGLQEGIDMYHDNPSGNGIQVTNPKTLAMLDQPTPTTYPQRREAARRGQRAGGDGRVRAAATDGLPIALPPRPLRRKPYQHEINASVDFSAIDSSFDVTLQQLQQEIRMARSFQIDELRDAIVGANGDLRKLSGIDTTVSASERIRRHLELVAGMAVDQAVQEANRQGVNVPRQPVSDLTKSLTARSDAIDHLLTTDIVQSARRESLRLTGGGLSPSEVADQTHVFLSGLVGAVATDLLGGAVQTSINEGRKLVFQRDGADGTLFASELLDTNTCSKCVAIDGTPYESISDAERDYPTGHFKDCEGRERCRGTILKVYAKAESPIAVPLTP